MKVFALAVSAISWIRLRYVATCGWDVQIKHWWYYI